MYYIDYLRRTDRRFDLYCRIGFDHYNDRCNYRSSWLTPINLTIIL